LNKQSSSVITRILKRKIKTAKIRENLNLCSAMSQGQMYRKNDTELRRGEEKRKEKKREEKRRGEERGEVRRGEKRREEKRR